MMIMGYTRFCIQAAKRLSVFGVISIALVACGSDDNKTQSYLNDVRTYKSDSPFQNEIPTCIDIEYESQSCQLTTLPTLGMEYNDPGIPQIMERVAVSHDWMGERFEELLHELPAEMIPLFRGVTAVVIDADIRPAFYSSWTGAIYLDPAYLWTTVEEKATINKKQDFRAEYDDPLAFRALWRYVKDNQRVSYVGSLYDDSTREVEDIVLIAAQLFLHELAHANDFVPPDAHDTFNINPNMSFLEGASSLEDQWASTILNTTQSLNSNTLMELAEVMFSGRAPTMTEWEMTAEEVGLEFQPDGAGDIYGYSTRFEDLAMLFETTMMKSLFDADYEMAFTSAPTDSIYCDDYIIGWGVRNRIGDDNVRDRAEFVATQILPTADLGNFFDTLEQPTEISGDWCFSSTNSINSSPQKPENSQVDRHDFIRPYL